MLDGTNTATASAEANLFKTGDFAPSINGNLEVNMNFGSTVGSVPLGTRLILGLKYAIDPCGTASEITAANLETMKGKIEAVNMVRDAFPFMSDGEAILFALGHRVSPEEADNVMGSMGIAGEIIAEDASVVPEPPCPETFNALIEGAAKAFSQKDREAWGKIIAEEATVAARCQKILDELSNAGSSKIEAKLMELCAEDTTTSSDANEKALKKLSEYGCIFGISVAIDMDRKRSFRCYDSERVVKRTDYPSLPERMKMDEERKMKELEERAVKRAKREIEEEMRRSTRGLA